jgi:hypothetical protein
MLAGAASPRRRLRCWLALEIFDRVGILIEPDKVRSEMAGLVAIAG